MTILITGATGNIGSRVLAKLAAGGHDVRGSARHPVDPGLVELDITDPGTAREALRGVAAMFLYPVRGEVDEFLAAARAAGVRYVVLLSSPAAYEAGEHDRVIGQAHRAVERSVVESGLSHTVLYPSWLASNALRDWATEIRRRGRIGIAYPDAEVAPIHPDDIADAAADLLTRDRHRGRMQVLTGPESLRLRDVAGTIGEVLGRPLPVDELSRDEAVARRPPWLPRPVLDVLLDASAAAVGLPATITNVVERITGHPARPFRDWVQAHRADFLPG